MECIVTSLKSSLIWLPFSPAWGRDILCPHSGYGTPTKRQVSKRQVSKRPVSKRQVY